MKKITLLITVFSFLILSCNKDDDQIVTQEKNNGFIVNSNFHNVNKAYYIPDLATEELDDFYIVITDGEIISLTESDKFKFSDNTRNYVIFRGIENPNSPTAVNFAPSGSYIFNSNNESFSSAHFNFDCESSNENLCQYMAIIDESSVPNVAVIDIENDGSTTNYFINFNIELSNSDKITGQYRGVLDTVELE